MSFYIQPHDQVKHLKLSSFEEFNLQNWHTSDQTLIQHDKLIQPFRCWKLTTCSFFFLLSPRSSSTARLPFILILNIICISKWIAQLAYCVFFFKLNITHNSLLWRRFCGEVVLGLRLFFVLVQLQHNIKKTSVVSRHNPITIILYFFQNTKNISEMIYFICYVT